MARCLFHSPKFAILDECTSGVSQLMERRLYQLCAERGITCITIRCANVTHRVAGVQAGLMAQQPRAPSRLAYWPLPCSSVQEWEGDCLLLYVT